MERRDRDEVEVGFFLAGEVDVLPEALDVPPPVCLEEVNRGLNPQFAGVAGVY